MLNKDKKDEIELNDEKQKELREVFDMLDIESSGVMDKNTLREAIRVIDNKFNVEMEYVSQLLIDTSLNKSLLDFDDFKKVMKRKMEVKDSRNELISAFGLFDEDGTGKITIDNLKNAAKELGEFVPEEELKEIFKHGDLDNDGVITLNDFLDLLEKKEEEIKKI